MRFAARFLLSFFLVILFSFLVSTKTFAQTAPTATNSPIQTNPYTVPNTNPDVPNNLHTWTQNVMIETMSSVICQLAGVDPINPKQECLGIDQKTNKIGFVKNGGGAIGFMGNMITMLYIPPVNTGEYFHSIAANFGITKHAYAQQQGTGFTGLQPLIGLWTAFRNIAYLIFVIVFVVMGLAIMLRVKIDPRTVMTIQNQIPKIIVGILLVTFSFAIAGFLIDIMYTSIYLTGNAIVGTDDNIKNSSVVSDIVGSTNPFAVANTIGGASGGGGGLANISYQPANAISGEVAHLLDNRIGQVVGAIVGGAIGGILGKSDTGKGIVKAVFAVGGAVVGSFFGIGPGTAAGASVGISVGNIIGNIIPGIIGGGVAGALFGGDIIGLLAGIVAFLVIVIAILWALFRLWFALISAYLFLLLDVVFAPFWIVAGLIPGSPVGFGLWMRDIIANLAAFPTAIIMFLMARVMIDSFAGAGTAFVPPMIGNFASPRTFSSIIGLGMILLTPGVVAMTKAALKAPKFDTSVIKQSLGVGAEAPGRAMSLGLEKAAMEDKNSNGILMYKPGALGIFGRLIRGR